MSKERKFKIVTDMDQNIQDEFSSPSIEDAYIRALDFLGHSLVEVQDDEDEDECVNLNQVEELVGEISIEKVSIFNLHLSRFLDDIVAKITITYIDVQDLIRREKYKELSSISICKPDKDNLSVFAQRLSDVTDLINRSFVEITDEEAKKIDDLIYDFLKDNNIRFSEDQE